MAFCAYTLLLSTTYIHINPIPKFKINQNPIAKKKKKRLNDSLKPDLTLPNKLLAKKKKIFAQNSIQSNYFYFYSMFLKEVENEWNLELI